MEKDFTKEELEETIISLSDLFTAEDKKRNEVLINYLIQKYEEDESIFCDEVKYLSSSISNYAGNLWKSRNNLVEEDRLKLSIIPDLISGKVNKWVRQIIDNVEGSYFAGDKESFIIGAIKTSLITGKNISLEYFYSENDTWLDDKSEYGKRAYWSPTTFKSTDEVIANYLLWSKRPELMLIKEENEENKTEE